MWMEENTIILASASPRRRDLLAAAGIRFEVRVAEVSEDFPTDLPSGAIAAFLARKKARAAKTFLSPERPVLLAADSVVLTDGRALGKPDNPEEARAMLQLLAGGWHEVITGVCLLSHERVKVFSETTRVRMEPLSQSEMDYYISRHNPFDKAGSYGIQEWIGLCKISAIEGSYTNVVGLPVHRVYAELQDFFTD
jgi:septum formation protein